MRLTRLIPDRDLSESGVKAALSLLYSDDALQEVRLVVSSAGINEGSRIAGKFKIKLEMDSDLPLDAWYIMSKYFGIFSPGA